MPLPCVRIVVTPLVEQRLRQLALEENRSVSQMGALILAQGIEQRREERASREVVSRLVEAIRSPSPDAAS